MLSLPYPGGPQIENLALHGNPRSFAFKAGQVKGKPFDFSFSGLKTAVLYKLRDPSLKDLTQQIKQDIAASFQQAAFEDVIKKTLKAAAQFNVKTIIFGGGVTNNRTLRHLFTQTSTDFSYLWPALGLSLDNAAMIAGLGYHTYLRRGKGDEMDLDPLTRISFADLNILDKNT